MARVSRNLLEINMHFRMSHQFAGPTGRRPLGADRPGVCGVLVREAGAARHLPPHLGHLGLDHEAGLQPPLLLIRMDG